MRRSAGEHQEDPPFLPHLEKQQTFLSLLLLHSKQKYTYIVYLQTALEICNCFENCFHSSSFSFLHGQKWPDHFPLLPYHMCAVPWDQTTSSKENEANRLWLALSVRRNSFWWSRFQVGQHVLTEEKHNVSEYAAKRMKERPSQLMNSQSCWLTTGMPVDPGKTHPMHAQLTLYHKWARQTHDESIHNPSLTGGSKVSEIDLAAWLYTVPCSICTLEVLKPFPLLKMGEKNPSLLLLIRVVSFVTDKS